MLQQWILFDKIWISCDDLRYQEGVKVIGDGDDFVALNFLKISVFSLLIGTRLDFKFLHTQRSVIFESQQKVYLSVVC